MKWKFIFDIYIYLYFIHRFISNKAWVFNTQFHYLIALFALAIQIFFENSVNMILIETLCWQSLAVTFWEMVQHFLYFLLKVYA